jgi:hypothetical protein
LQRVGRAVSFQRPHFHFTEALTTELCLTTQRLLGNEAVRASRTGMDFVFDQMRQLEHMDQSDGHRAIKRFTSAAIIQRVLTIDWQWLAGIEHYLIGNLL